jgi:hypothetical protein
METEVECPECGTVIRGEMANLDQSIPIELPIEPPRNRIMEMVKDGEVIHTFTFDEKVDEWQNQNSFHLSWYEIVGDAISAGATLRHVPDLEERCI